MHSREAHTTISDTAERYTQIQYGTTTTFGLQSIPKSLHVIRRHIHTDRQTNKHTHTHTHQNKLALFTFHGQANRLIHGRLACDWSTARDVHRSTWSRAWPRYDVSCCRRADESHPAARRQQAAGDSVGECVGQEAARLMAPTTCTVHIWKVSSWQRREGRSAVSEWTTWLTLPAILSSPARLSLGDYYTCVGLYTRVQLWDRRQYTECRFEGRLTFFYHSFKYLLYAIDRKSLCHLKVEIIQILT